MKKNILLIAAVVLFANGVFAQKYNTIKDDIAIGQIAKAKEEFDKFSKDEKFFTKPEGYIIKAAIFASLSVDSSLAAEADNNRAQANEAFQKYKEMESDMKLVEDAVYKNTPFNLYASYYNSGINDINNKAYEPAFEKFKQAVDYSELLIAKKIIDKKMDTSAIYYTGLLAENTKHPEDAQKYYLRIADNKIKEYQGTSYESVYQGLVRYYAGKNDNANFEKYKALGKELFPESEFFTYTMIDFAVGGSSNFNERVASLEKLLAASPEDYKANLTFAEIIYDTLNTRKEGAVRPGNADELETKMLAALNKAASLNTNETQPLLLLADHYLFKSEKLRDKVVEAETELLKKGAKATAAEKQKYADANKAYGALYDLSNTNYEKAAELFAKMPTLDDNQKRTYRIIVGNIAQYYSVKIQDTKGADRDKFVALEKKWDQLYTKLK